MTEQSKNIDCFRCKTGFWQVKLDKQSSYLITFNTSFGRYRWLRISFGINSAPEVWQQHLSPIVEGLTQVEVVADDFLIYGVGDTTEEAVTNHDLVLTWYDTFQSMPSVLKVIEPLRQLECKNTQ